MLSIINTFLRHRVATTLVKVFTLLVFIFLIYSGFSAYSTDSSFLIQLRNTNIGNLLVWSYWWPFIVIGAIFFGRIWCMVCPVELVTSLAAKVGLRRKRPALLTSGWMIPLFYTIILLVGIQGLSIHRNPYYMAWYLLAIMLLSILIGWLYEKNTFCKYVCPIGLLLAMYSKLSWLGWRVKRPEVCSQCRDKSCVASEHLYKHSAKSCGIGLYPASISDNDACVLCGGCARSCQKYQERSPSEARPNPEWQRIGFANGLLNSKPLQYAECAFLLILSGFVISEIWTEWGATKAILNTLSLFFIHPLAIENSAANKVLHGVIIFILLPLALWLLPFGMAKILGSRTLLKSYLMYAGLAFIPIMAAAHAVKALLKSTSRLPYFEYLFQDIIGMTNAQKIIDKEMVLHTFSPSIYHLITAISLFFLIAGIGLSVGVLKRLQKSVFLDKRDRVFYLIPLLYGGIFIGMLCAWRVL